MHRKGGAGESTQTEVQNSYPLNSPPPSEIWFSGGEPEGVVKFSESNPHHSPASSKYDPPLKKFPLLPTLEKFFCACMIISMYYGVHMS